MSSTLLQVEPVIAVNVSFDGKPLIAEANESILSCARRYGIHIPTLCELNDIDHAPAPAGSAWWRCACPAATSSRPSRPAIRR